MKKIAIFVEGLTERIFIDKLLQELITEKKLAIKSVDASGGKKCPRFTVTITEDIITNETKFQILVFNSCTDNRVLSDIRDNYESLSNNGYTTFIGIRDLFPDYLYTEKTEAFEDANFFISSFQNTFIIFATMETETWLIGELNHYTNLDSSLTLTHIKDNLIDLENIDFEKDITNPADMLHAIYQLKGKNWEKTESQITETIESLDYENLYCETRNKIPSLNQLITELDIFFTE